MSDKINITVHVNGQKKSAQVSPELPLLEFLQEDLGLTGTKFCCGIGVCRACTVGSRNSPDAPMEKTLSCSTPMSILNGMHIHTIEGLGTEDELSPLQEAFLEHFSFQCGYCTSGFLMAATALIERLQTSPVADNELDDLIKVWVGDNICRCTGYVRYFEAIKNQFTLTC